MAEGDGGMLYYFLLKDGRQVIPDQEGEELPDAGAARLHAVTVAQQLVRNRGVAAHKCSIQVCDDYLQPLFQVSFAEADTRLGLFPPQLKEAVVRAARTTGMFTDAVFAVRKTMAEVRQTLAQADEVLARLGPQRDIAALDDHRS